MKLPKVPHAESYQLANGLTVRSLCGGNHDILRVSLCIPAGLYYAPDRIIGTYTSSMITKGTNSLSAEEWAKRIEYYGAYTQSFSTNHYKIIMVSCLTKHFANIWPLIAEAVIAPAFEESELELERARSIQAFKMQLMRTNFVAMRATSVLHDKNSHYAKLITLDSHKSVTTDHIKRFHSEAYLPNGAFVMISGKPDDEVFRTIDNTLNEKVWKKGDKLLSLPPVVLNPSPEHRIHIPMEGKTQSTLVIACPTISPFHPDYHALNLAVHIFGGGYLGSRLMQNIREQKGLTYGIGAYCMDNPTFNSFIIQSDLNSDKVEETIDEIRKEMDILKHELVPQDEFDEAIAVLKNQILQSLDGTITTAESLLNMYIRDMDEDYLQRSCDYLDIATPEDVLRCAEKYLDLDSCIIIDAGK
ncbi:MAG: insulinase family protein [Bacteroidales bacterium]|nr:insulinase family protein [Bacteroidales bacterium]